jgi:phenylacetic acid degradation operon negative regulatory protein
MKTLSEPSLKEKILIFIGYCLPELNYKFSYEKMQEIFIECYEATYSIKTLRKEISNLKRDKLLTTTKRYRKNILSLTREGRLKIIPHLPFKKYDPWDNKWRIIIFSIPETDRKYRLELQKKLHDLSFQKIHKGVYISPHPTLNSIHKFSTQLGIRQHLILFEASEIEQEKRTIQKIWQLDEINKEYKKFIKLIRKIKQKEYWPLKAKELENNFYNIYARDPHLPPILLPTPWYGDRAYKIYRQIATSY